MKKQILLCAYIALSASCLVAQNPPLIDSADVQAIGDLVNTATTLNGDKDLIPGVSDAVTGGVFVGILALIVRIAEKFRLRKKGKLTK